MLNYKNMTSLYKTVYTKFEIKILLFIFNIFLITGIYWLVYVTGGIKYVFSHSMYLVIILNSIIFGLKGGIVTGFIGGIALGPYMPIDTITGEKQELVNWIYRLMFYLGVGSVNGYIFDRLKHKIKYIIGISNHNLETNIPNLFSITNNIDKYVDNKSKLLIIVKFINITEIANLLGRNSLVQILKNAYQRLEEANFENVEIVQVSSNKLLIIFPGDDEEFFCNQISYLLRKSFDINNIPIYVEHIIGVTSTTISSSLEITNAIRNAETALNYAIRNDISYAHYQPDHIRINKNNLELLGNFLNALKTDETVLFYQPKVDLNTNKTVGFEALIRWIHPERGMITPADFIPLVEETQLINPLTEWVLDKSLIKLKKMHQNNIHVTIAINISTKNLMNPRFLERIIRIFEKHRIPSTEIEFEITESALMKNPEKSNYLLNSLRNYHIILSIDDFGTGYSSLAYLSRLPINIIKIDQYFIKNLQKNSGLFEIVKSTIELSHNLGLKVVAEGVENQEIMDILKELKCDYIQGYYISKPLPDEDVIDWYTANNFIDSAAE